MPRLIKTVILTPSGKDAAPIGCKYEASDFTFSVVVVDKNLTQGNQGADAKFQSFDRYQKSKNEDEIKNFSMTDTISTAIIYENLYENISDNALAYTAEVYQNFPGSGIYQAVTEINNIYLVYMTYTLFPATDEKWANYLNQYWSSDKNNAGQVFNEYMSLTLGQKVVMQRIKELNSIIAIVGW